MDKKGQIDQLGQIIVGLIAVGIVLVVGFLILTEAKDQIINIEDTTSWCSNESLYGKYALVTSGGSAECCNTTACTTGNDAAGTANYTYNVSADTCCNITTSLGVNCSAGQTIGATSAISCLAGNTTPAAPSFAWNGTEQTQNALQEIPRWLPIIVIVLISIVIVGLIAIFRRRQ